jgi:hypothetical protein
MPEFDYFLAYWLSTAKRAMRLWCLLGINSAARREFSAPFALSPGHAIHLVGMVKKGQPDAQ